MAQQSESRDLDKVIVRLPDGMRDRIKKSAERNGRSMNAEIVKALESVFPPEPSIEDVLDRVHNAIEAARSANSMPYRDVLIDALDNLSEQLASGIEFDQFRPSLPPAMADDLRGHVDRLRRWQRAKKFGVDQADLERELSKGLLRRLRGHMVRDAIEMFEKGKPERALIVLNLRDVKFADPKAAAEAIEKDLREYYAENWGDIKDPPPWADEDPF